MFNILACPQTVLQCLSLMNPVYLTEVGNQKPEART